jgi:hypothetical protein
MLALKSFEKMFKYIILGAKLSNEFKIVDKNFFANHPKTPGI